MSLILKEELRRNNYDDLPATVKKAVKEKKPRAVFLDLDGTLCATETLQFYILVCILSIFGIEYSVEHDKVRRNCKSYERYFYSFIGLMVIRSTNEFAKEFINSILARGIKEDIATFVGKLILNCVAKNSSRLLHWYKGELLRPGVKETLDFLEDEGIKIGLASLSGRDSLFQKIDALGIASYFLPCNVVSRDDMPDWTKRKPDPECYNRLLGLMRIGGEDALVIEDTSIGVEAGALAGCRTIAFLDDDISVTPEFTNFTASSNVKFWFDDKVEGIELEKIKF